ncbi:hypothetical protein D6C97_06620 [Aureobasidium pullulans]|nr:hypothetical protein D6C97_06620 [Aureobasidium pullulans]
MNHTEQAQPWPQPDHHMDMQDIDFSNFLDIGDIGDIGNLDVSDFPALDGPDSQVMASTGSLHDFGAEAFEMPTTLDVQNFGQVQQWGHQQVPQNMYRPPNIVPPTPNSFELQGNARHYMSQHMESGAGPFFDQHHRLNKDDNMAFTPLVSPAVTPRDSTFHPIPEYTIPGAYFSPLTSPALHAQQQQQQQQTRSYAHNQYTNPTTADSSAAASPLDLNMDLDTAKDMTEAAPRRSRRKAQPPHSAGPAARVRQSPIVKGQRRRSAHLSTVIPPREVSNILLEAQSQAQGARTPSAEYMPFESSGAESISPEALPDLLMGPPPLPASAYHSPALHPQTQSAPASTAIHSHQPPCDPCPATPASLMSIRKSQQQNGTNHAAGPHPGSGQFQIQSQDSTGMLEDLALPPAAAGPTRPALNRIVTTVPSETTPRLAPKGTPRLAPSQSHASSPSLTANYSPAIAPTPSFSGKKPDPKRAQPAKKRGSVSTSSALVSPAIRPKISPSIKPLLPEGGLSESQQALLLASKSNYTHLLEGTRLPGVSYPESLSMGLTSKRTSHKIAEQGRRNRINEAIKEMQTLLPKLKGKARAEELAEEEEEANAKDGKGNNTAEGRSANSKAATVESAIDYIKMLQQEKNLAFEMLKKKDEEMAALRKQLQAADINTTATDSANDSAVASSGDENSAEPEKMEGVSATPLGWSGLPTTRTATLPTNKRKAESFNHDDYQHLNNGFRSIRAEVDFRKQKHPHRCALVAYTDHKCKVKSVFVADL